MVGQRGREVVFGGARQVGDVGPLAVDEFSGSPYHGVGVGIDGVDGVGQGHAVVPPEQLLDVGGVALGSVVDEYLVLVEVYAAGEEVALHDGLAQEVVAVLRAVAAEGVDVAHLVGGLLHGLHHGRRQGAGHVANAEADDALLGMRHLEGRDALGDVGEEVAARKTEVIFVY